MYNFSFTTKSDLLDRMHEFAASLKITNNIINNDLMVTFVCEHSNSCEAIINGVYNSKTNLYIISRIQPSHTCINGGGLGNSTSAVTSMSKRDLSSEILWKALKFEFKAEKYKKLSLGHITKEILVQNYPLGYFDVFRLISDMSPLMEQESEMATINSLTMNKAILNNTVSSHLILACMREFNTEFLKLNPSVFTAFSESFYFFSIPYDSLRPVNEIKVYKRPDGFLILNIRYDPNDEGIIESVLISRMGIKESLEEFVRQKEKTVISRRGNASKLSLEGLDSGGNTNFDVSTVGFLIDCDLELIEILNLLKVDFFIKSRSLVQFLEETNINDGNYSIMELFNILNYGDTELLSNIYGGMSSSNTEVIDNLDRAKYLKRFCKFDLFNLNNSRSSDFEFISEELLKLDFFDCLNLLIWHISDDLKSRKSQGNLSENVISDQVQEIINRGEEMILQAKFKGGSWNNYFNIDLENFRPDLYSKTCECNKFQEFQIPCIHAIHMLKLFSQRKKKRSHRHENGCGTIIIDKNSISTLLDSSQENQGKENSNLTNADRKSIIIPVSTQKKISLLNFDEFISKDSCINSIVKEGPEKHGIVSFDPTLYVSKYYQKYSIRKLLQIVPLVELGPPLYKNLKK